MKIIYSSTEKAGSLLRIRSGDREGQEGENMKKHKQCFGDIGDVSDLDHAGAFVGMYACPN